MFNSRKKSETTGIINTIIGENSKIEGLLSASDSTRVDGLLQGKILSESSVIIGEHGVVRGDINAVEILVAGTVYGNLRAEQRIEITETGRVLGDLFTKILIIDEGASFKGNCSMEVMMEKSDWEKLGVNSPTENVPDIKSAGAEKGKEASKDAGQDKQKPSSADSQKQVEVTPDGGKKNDKAKSETGEKSKKS